MARDADGVVRFAQSEESAVLTSGTHVFGPFAIGGVTSLAVMYDDRLGAAPSSCTCNAQHSLQSPRTPDEDIVWSDPIEISQVGGIGEFQSSVEISPVVIASLFRVVVTVPATQAIKLYFLAGSRNL